MKKNFTIYKSLIVGIIIIFISSSFTSSIYGYSDEIEQRNIEIVDINNEVQEDVLVTCNTFGFPGKQFYENNMHLNNVELLYDKIKELQIEVARDSLSDTVHQLQKEIITIAKEHNLLPKDVSIEEILLRLNPEKRTNHPLVPRPHAPGKASEMFCNYVSTGSGSALPIIIFPRFVPILLTPIPRLFVRWSTYEGITSCGGLQSGKGFIASGAQRGIALGFWGIGFSIFIPPVKAYGLFGYALYASVNAENITFWPPNNPPIISDESPPDGAWNVPISLNELSFQINDADDDLMSYSVSTNPEIGSGSGTNKGNGIYTIPVSGLQSNTLYQWIVEITDSKDITIEEFSFMTEELPFDPYNEGWQYRKKITIDHTQVDGDLSYFPVLVSTLDTDLSNKAQDDGDDILFMNKPGVAHKLHHEIEYYDDSTGELVAWVNVPIVHGNEDTIFYMYYGNPSSISQQVPERVWDSNYIMVQHMYSSDEMIYDSTINDNDGIIFEATGTTGTIGKALHFDGNSYVEFSPVILLDNDFSVEYWIKLEEYTSYPRVIGYDGREYITEIWSPDYKIKMANSRVEDNCDAFGNSNNWDDGSWWYIVITKVGVNVNFYYNSVDETFDGNTCSNLYERIKRIGGHGNNNDWFIGNIDETRISNKARNQDWITTSYHTMNDPSSFMSFGPEETGP